MSLFTKTANDTFAAYDVAGNAREIVPQDAQVWGTEVEAIVNAFVADGGIIYLTKSEIDGDLTPGNRRSAWVVADPAAANNGIYRKNGASGTGSWARVANLPYSFIIAADAGAGTANAIQATTTIPVSSSALIWTNIYEANTSSPVTVSFNGSSPLTIKTNGGQNISAGGLVAGMIVMGIVSGSTFRLISDQTSAAVLAAAEAAVAEAETLVGQAATALQPEQLANPNGSGGEFVILKRSEASTVALHLKERLGLEFAPLIEWTGKISDPNDTAAFTTKIQASFDEMATKGGLFVPPGRFPYSSVTWPDVENFNMVGAGNGAVFVQKGSGLKFPTRATTCLNANGLIANLAFDGRDGTGNTIDTTYAQTIELNDLYFYEAPDGFSSIKLDGNPNDGTYMHDVRVNRARMYHTNGYVPPSGGAHPIAFVELGAYTADSEINEMIAQGFKDLDYIILARAGAQTTRVVSSHLYNARKNIVRLEGFNADFSFTDDTFDYCDEDNVRIINGVKNRFSACFFQFIKTGYSGLLLDNSYRTIVAGSSFSAESTAAEACVKEINGSSDNKVLPGIIDDATKYTDPFQMSGAKSFATGFADDSPAGNHGYLEGVAQAPIARNVAAALGMNGAAPAGNTSWRKLSPGRVLSAWVAIDSASAQSQVFNVKRGSTTIGTITIPAGSFLGEVRIPIANQRWAGGGSTIIYIEYTGNTDAGTFSPSYGIEFVE